MPLRTIEQNRPKLPQPFVEIKNQLKSLRRFPTKIHYYSDGFVEQSELSSVQEWQKKFGFYNQMGKAIETSASSSHSEEIAIARELHNVLGWVLDLDRNQLSQVEIKRIEEGLKTDKEKESYNQLIRQTPKLINRDRQSRSAPQGEKNNIETIPRSSLSNDGNLVVFLPGLGSMDIIINSKKSPGPLHSN